MFRCAYYYDLFTELQMEVNSAERKNGFAIDEEGNNKIIPLPPSKGDLLRNHIECFSKLLRS